jgi:hypothetical protein
MMVHDEHGERGRYSGPTRVYTSSLGEFGQLAVA